MDYDNILKAYQAKKDYVSRRQKDYDKKMREALAKAEKYQAIAARKMTLYHKLLQEKNKNAATVSWIGDALVPLVNEVCTVTGYTVKTDNLRTYGLRAECPVFFFLPGESVPFVHLVFTSSFDEGRLTIYVDTGETTNHFAQDSIGAINGCNNVTKKVTSVEEIVEILKTKTQNK